MNRLRRHLSFANITAVLALVVATSGSAYAATLITSKQIQNGTIKNVDIHAGAIRAAKLAPSARSNAYTYAANGVLTIPYVDTAATITTLSIDTPGSYLITATFSLQNNDSASHFVQCQMDSGEATGNATSYGSAGLDVAGSGAYASPMVMQMAHTFSATATVKVTCTAATTYAGSNRVNAYHPVITALQVDSVQ